MKATKICPICRSWRDRPTNTYILHCNGCFRRKIWVHVHLLRLFFASMQNFVREYRNDRIPFACKQSLAPNRIHVFGWFLLMNEKGTIDEAMRNQVEVVKWGTDRDRADNPAPWSYEDCVTCHYAINDTWYDIFYLFYKENYERFYWILTRSTPASMGVFADRRFLLFYIKINRKRHVNHNDNASWGLLDPKQARIFAVTISWKRL